MPIITLSPAARLVLRTAFPGELTHEGKTLAADGSSDCIVTLELFQRICARRNAGETYSVAALRLGSNDKGPEKKLYPARKSRFDLPLVVPPRNLNPRKD